MQLVHPGRATQEGIGLRRRHRPPRLNAATSQFGLAKANGKQDLNVSFNYSHVSGASTGSLFFNIPLPVFNRNQGEIARSRYALDQATLQSKATEQTALTDVKNAYEAVQASQDVVELYQSGYLKQAQESRDISEFAYKQGAAALLDFLDAERSGRLNSPIGRRWPATCWRWSSSGRQWEYGFSHEHATLVAACACRWFWKRVFA